MQVPTEEQRRRVGALVAEDRWVLDTAYGSWTDLVLPRAELVVALDYPRWISLGRLLRRTALRLVDRREVCNGNSRAPGQPAQQQLESFRWHFQSFPPQARPHRGLGEQSHGPDVLRFRSPRETEDWLARAGR